jgi:hypothetical protein
MNLGKVLFVQLMDFLYWRIFHRFVVIIKKRLNFLHPSTDFLAHLLRENAHPTRLHDIIIHRESDRLTQSIVSIRFLTGHYCHYIYLGLFFSMCYLSIKLDNGFIFLFGFLQFYILDYFIIRGDD